MDGYEAVINDGHKFPRIGIYNTKEEAEKAIIEYKEK